MKTLAVGLFKASQGGMSVEDLRGFVERGETRLLVPIDPKISPWPLPKLFALDRSQALTLMSAFEQATDTQTRVAYLLRGDGTVALIRRDDADTGLDGVPAGGT